MAPLWWATYKSHTLKPGTYNNNVRRVACARAALRADAEGELGEAGPGRTASHGACCAGVGLNGQECGRIKRAVAANDNTHTCVLSQLVWCHGAVSLGHRASVSISTPPTTHDNDLAHLPRPMLMRRNLAWFSAALVAGNAAHLPGRFLNICAGAWLASRVAYTLAYVNGETGRLARFPQAEGLCSLTR